MVRWLRMLRMIILLGLLWTSVGLVAYPGCNRTSLQNALEQACIRYYNNAYTVVLRHL
jgi:hypothetical protein